MKPKIEPGQLITLSPDISKIEKGDIVLCKVNSRYYVYLISTIQGERFQISNNKGHVNDLVERSGIFGKVIEVEA